VTDEIPAGFGPKLGDPTGVPRLGEVPDVEDILDPAEVLIRCNRNGDLGATMLQLFAESLPADLESLDLAAAATDLAALGRTAHKLRGAAAMLGAARLADAIGGLQRVVGTGDDGPLADRLADVRHESALLLGVVPQTVRRLTEQGPWSPATS
jgi:HPt (histidine-containing phosphotransfer) domain-containing protein